MGDRENERAGPTFRLPQVIDRKDRYCTNCGTQLKHFWNEGKIAGAGQNKHLSFLNCCRHGKLDSLNPMSAPPELFVELFKDKDFMKQIRSYNSAIAMASCGGNIDKMKGGPFVFRLHGQLYHHSGPLHPAEGEQPKYAQLYVYDSEEASTYRMDNPANKKCNSTILELLHDFMEANNQLVRCYKMLKEVEEEMTITGQDTRNVVMSISTQNNYDPRRYNVARANEIAMVFTNDEGAPPFERDIRVYLRQERGVRNINLLNAFLDGLTYPLFFPYGQKGWTDQIMTSGGNKITEMQYFSFYLQVRKDETNHLLCGAKLTHQLMVDWYCRMEANRLQYLRYNQKKMKAESYSALHEYVQNRATLTGKSVGRTVICPSSYIGSPRNMQQRYQDAMAIVRKFGKPDLFITVTMNPKAKEVMENLYPGQSPQDRPDIVARVFNIKLKAIIEDITKKNIFGKCKGFVYVIEFQKRGLPHAHILWIGSELDLKDPKWVDEIVSAEIPAKECYPKLYEAVTTHMLHGPCSEKCMKDGACTKRFPKPFQEHTDTSVDGFPLYMRKDNGSKFQKGKHTFTNQHVVPYNPYLLLKYNCHINVEVCSSVKAVKYIYKYIYKGHDCADLLLNETDCTVNVDEINQHVNARYVSAPEAMWRIYGFWMQDKSHTIYRLHVHEPNEQTLYYNEGDEEQALDAMKDSNLSAYFKLNSEDADARRYLYSDIPNYYTFSDVKDVATNKKFKVWKKRRYGYDDNVIGRMYNVSPSNMERYSIKLLLLNKRGAVSFDDLKTVNGNVCKSFHEACVLLNLAENDDQWYHAINEALIYQMPRQLRQLFALILVFGAPANALEMYEHYKEHFYEDFLREHPLAVAEQLGLHEIEDILKAHRKTGKDFGLPQLERYMISSMHESFDMDKEKETFSNNYAKLNDDQRTVVKHAIEAINTPNCTKNCIHLNGPGGSGKTFVYETLMSYVRGTMFNGSQGVAIAVASTGIAATLLKGGRTYHSQFCIPPNPDKDTTSSMRTNSAEADRIRKAQIIIWDECTMACKYSLNVVNRLLQEIMDNTRPFGGKLCILGGDFRQILNVVKRGNRVAIIETNVKSSVLWKHFTTFKLHANMRAVDDALFSEWVLKLGDGKLNMKVNENDDTVEIPQHFVTQNDIVFEIFQGINEGNIEEYANRAILCPLNDDAAKINKKVLDLLPGTEKSYTSADTIDSANESDVQNYPVEYLNSINPSGLPPHNLKLKVGAIIMLLRNLNTKRGMCNGTRLIVKELKDNLIFATVLVGRAKGETVFLPRITLTSNEGEYPFVLRRRQFPIKLSFSMTINKSQGQSLRKVGIFLAKPVFTHGQLYVAFSRANSKESVRVYVKKSLNQGELLGEGSGTFTQNCVYPEIL